VPIDTDAKPFASAIGLMEAEITAAVARCRRIGVERKLAEDHRDDRHRIGVVGDVAATLDEEERRRLNAARAGEEAAQAMLEARRSATRKAGVIVGLDALCEQHGLTEADRAALVLTAIPAVSREMAVCFDGISVHGYGSDLVSIEAVANYLELGFVERIGFVRRFRAEAPLVRHGLLNVDVGRSCDPQDWTDAVIKFTSKAFATMTGVEVEGDANAEVCPGCGRTMPS